MSDQVLLQLADFAQSSTMVIAFCAFLPQLRTIHRNKSSKNISLKAWSMWTFSAFLGLFYAVVQYHVHGDCIALVLSSLVGVLLNIIALGLAVYYREEGLAYPLIPVANQVEDIERTNLQTSSALAMVESISATPVDKQVACSSSSSIL